MDLKTFTASVLSQPRINEVWVLPVPSDENLSLSYPVHAVKVYHVENSEDGLEWTADRNKYPHITDSGRSGLIECVPDSVYTSCQANYYMRRDGYMDPEVVAADWNQPAPSQDLIIGGVTFYNAAGLLDDPDYTPYDSSRGG